MFANSPTAEKLVRITTNFWLERMKRPDGTTMLNGSTYYWFFFVLMLLTLVA